MNPEKRKVEIERVDALISRFISCPAPKDAIGYGQGQKRIIRYLQEHPEGAYPSDLAANCSVGSGRIGNVLKELERKGILKRDKDPHDKRKTITKLTKKGIAYSNMMRNLFINRFERLFDLYGEEKFDEYLSLSEKLIDNLERIKMEEEKCLKPTKI